MASARSEKTRMAAVLKQLRAVFPEPRLELDFTNPLECLIATILSAQCTDKRVNQVTPALFEKYVTASDYAAAPQARLEAFIKPTGFFRAKAKSIAECCRALVDRHGGVVPADRTALTKLPGVGRKTANVVLGAAFGRQAIAVDTHVKRVSLRLGFTSRTDPDKIEQDLSKLIPSGEWTASTMRFILFGRRICEARLPRCPECPVVDQCPYRGQPQPNAGRPNNSLRQTHLRPPKASSAEKDLRNLRRCCGGGLYEPKTPPSKPGGGPPGKAGGEKKRGARGAAR